MRSLSVLSITLLATGVVAAPVYGTGNSQEISAHNTLSKVQTHISAVERRQPDWPSSSRIGTKTYKGDHDQLVAHIIKNQAAQPPLNSATHQYIGETAKKMEGVEKPPGLDQHASADAAAKHLISTNHPYAKQVISKYQETVGENDGAKGQGTLLGNRPESHIV